MLPLGTHCAVEKKAGVNAGTAAASRSMQAIPHAGERAFASGKLPDSIAFAVRDARRSPPPRVQPKLVFGASDDHYEREADSVADSVIGMGTPAQSSSVAAAPLRVQGSGGAPLSPEIRAYFEPRFGYDFGHVRIHTDASSASAAGSLGARAYTQGGNITFGAHEYAPGTTRGKRLIAHELAHVVQQSTGLGTGRIQAKPKDDKTAEITRTPFPVKIKGAMTTNELAREFIRQYYGAMTDAEVDGKLPLWNFRLHPPTPEEISKGEVIFMVGDQDRTDFDKLGPDEKKRINAETDRRFWARTGYKPGQKLGHSAQDRQMADAWKGMRNAVLTEERQRKAIDALPQDIKDVLFSKDATVTVSPNDYTQVLRIAQKLTQLTPDERRDYLSRVNAASISWNELEQSVDRYLQFREEREKQAATAETTAKPLLGAEDIYTRYKNYKSLKANASLAHALRGPAKDKAQAEESIAYLDQRVQEEEDALLAALKLKGFDSIAAFEQAIEAYRVTFRTQAVNVALDLLARYEHKLFEERKRLQNPDYARGIASGIGATQASQHYTEASSKSFTASLIESTHDPKDIANAASDRREISRLRSESASARATAENEVNVGSGNDPLVAERSVDRQKLAGLDAAGVQTYLTATIDKLTEEIRSARQEFNDDPDRVFKLPDLIAGTMEAEGIGPNTIYGRIIKDYIEEQRLYHLLSELAKGILALALAALVPVGGWIAAAALVANAGLSVYQAYGAYKEYAEEQRDYDLNFLSDEPSLFWVGVAIAGAALDLGVATSAVVKESATALKSLKGPMLEFSKDGDLAKLTAKIEAAEGLQTKVRQALEREAQASLDAKQAFKELGGKLFAFSPFGPPDPRLVTGAFRALYYSVKRGITTLTRLSADAQFLAIAGDVTRLTGVERAELETAFEEVKQLVRVGKSKSMDDVTLLEYVDRWSVTRGDASQKAKVLEEMKTWKPLTPEQKRALDAVVDQKTVVADLYREKDELIAEREALSVKQRDPLTRTEEGRQRLQEINHRLGELDPSFKQKTVKKAVSVTDAQGNTTMHYVDVPIQHPTGDIEQAEAFLSKAEKEAADSQVTLYDRLRAAAPSEAARERTLKGVTADQVGALKTAAGPLQAEHIVSVREIADMDGFSQLTWKDQKAIVDMPDNLIAMDKSANASKGSRSWRFWDQASTYYDPSTIDAMIKREAEVRAAIKAQIKARLSSPRH